MHSLAEKEKKNFVSILAVVCWCIFLLIEAKAMWNAGHFNKKKDINIAINIIINKKNNNS